MIIGDLYLVQYVFLLFSGKEKMLETSVLVFSQENQITYPIVIRS